MVEKELAVQVEEIYLEPKLEKDLQERLSRIEGHIRGIKKMLSEHQDCNSLLVQIGAVKAAINQVAVKLLEGHMETCIKDAVHCGEGKEALGQLKTAISMVLK